MKYYVTFYMGYVMSSVSIGTRSGRSFNIQNGLSTRGKPITIKCQSVEELKSIKTIELNLSNESVQLIADGQIAIVDDIVIGTVFYKFVLNSSQQESLPGVINPVNNPSTGRWIKMSSTLLY